MFLKCTTFMSEDISKRFSHKQQNSHSRSQSYQTFIFIKWTFIPYFAIELDCFIVHALFSYDTNTQAKQRKFENKENQRLVGLTPGIIFLVRLETSWEQARS